MGKDSSGVFMLTPAVAWRGLTRVVLLRSAAVRANAFGERFFAFAAG
jgi:hypothetical protein